LRWREKRIQHGILGQALFSSCAGWLRIDVWIQGGGEFRARRRCPWSMLVVHHRVMHGHQIDSRKKGGKTP